MKNLKKILKVARLYFLILFIVISIPSLGQIIESVHFNGIKKTKREYLQRFLALKAGDQLDSVNLYLSIKQLSNLEMISSASFHVTSEDTGGLKITFDCVEQRSLLPIISFGGIEENFRLQVGISEVNLNGRGNKLFAYYQHYDRSSLSIHLILNRIKGTNWGLALNSAKLATVEPLYFNNLGIDYSYNNLSTGASILRYLNVNQTLEIGGTFFKENFRKRGFEPVDEAPSYVIRNKALIKSEFTSRNLHSHYFYTSGFTHRITLQSVYSLEDNNWFHQISYELKGYQRVGDKGNLCFRNQLGLSTNEDSPFAPFVLDSYTNVRGIGNRIDRSTGIISLNIEYRHTIVEKAKNAMQFIVFSDNALWRSPGHTIEDILQGQNTASYIGLGARFIRKDIANAVFRIDYGRRISGNRTSGFVLGIGQYF